MCNIARGPPRITANLIKIFFDCHIDQFVFELLSTLPSFLSPLFSSLLSLNQSINNNNLNNNNNNNNNNDNNKNENLINNNNLNNNNNINNNNLNNNNNNKEEMEKRKKKLEDEIKFASEVGGEGCWLSSYLCSSNIFDIGCLLHISPDLLSSNDFSYPPSFIVCFFIIIFIIFSVVFFIFIY